jgi:YVTN family beta-propeller protein
MFSSQTTLKQLVSLEGALMKNEPIRSRIALAAWLLLALLCARTNVARAALGDLRATFPFYAADFQTDPARPYIYISQPANDAIGVVDTNTLSVIHTIALPGSPGGIALSPDGNSLYVADNGNKSIDQIDLQSFSISKSIPLTISPIDLAAGANNQLYVMGREIYWEIHQVNAATGATSFFHAQGVPSSKGNLHISPDLATLYFAEIDGTGGRIYSIDVTGTPQLAHVTANSNGVLSKPMVLSRNGALLSQAGGPLPSGVHSYSIPLFRANDLGLVGTIPPPNFNLPEAVAFSPDDRVLFAATALTTLRIDLYDTTNLSNKGSFAPPASGAGQWLMSTDQSGRYLFVSFTGVKTQVFDTGLSIPEPSAAMLGALASVICLIRKNGQCRRA